MIASHMNKISSTVTTTLAYDSNLDDSDANKSDSNVNKSDSNVYFKSNDSDFDDEYDHELHERLTYKEMARIAKLHQLSLKNGHKVTPSK